MGLGEAAPDGGGAGDHADADAGVDEEPFPIVLRRFLQNQFERGEEHRGETDGAIVDAAKLRKFGLADADEERDQNRDDGARGEVDEEYGVPGAMLGQIAADRRADRRR